MGVRNTLGDLNNHLFEQLERLNDESTKGDNLKEELERSRAMAHISKNIIDNARLILDAEKFKDDRMNLDGNDLRLLSSD